MDNKIELFERYIDREMTQEEETAFERRLRNDKEFLNDFRIYLFTVDGIIKEEMEDGIEFAHALKNISDAGFEKAIGGKKPSTSVFRKILVERIAWAASIAVIVIGGAITIYNVERNGRYELDNTIVAYNYVHVPSRGGSESVDITSLSEKELQDYIPRLEEAYRTTPADDVQECEEAGMNLALAYLKLHNRKEALYVLRELSERFADDEYFAAQCQRIIKQIE